MAKLLQWGTDVVWIIKSMLIAATWPPSAAWRSFTSSLYISSHCILLVSRPILLDWEFHIPKHGSNFSIFSKNLSSGIWQLKAAARIASRWINSRDSGFRLWRGIETQRGCLDREVVADNRQTLLHSRLLRLADGIQKTLDKATYLFQLLHHLFDQASYSDNVANTKANRHRHHGYLNLQPKRYVVSREESNLWIAEFQACRALAVGSLISGLCYIITCHTTCFRTNTSS